MFVLFPQLHQVLVQLQAGEKEQDFSAAPIQVSISVQLWRLPGCHEFLAALGRKPPTPVCLPAMAVVWHGEGSRILGLLCATVSPCWSQSLSLGLLPQSAWAGIPLLLLASCGGLPGLAPPRLAGCEHAANERARWVCWVRNSSGLCVLCRV